MRRRSAFRFAASLICAGSLAGGSDSVRAASADGPHVSALAVARRLRALGPRTPGSEAHRVARERLLEEMLRAGLEELSPPAEPGRGDLVNLSGILPGGSGQEIVLSARYYSVLGSRSPADDAAGIGVVLAAVADLAQTPRRHTLRVVLFDGEEAGHSGSRTWLDRLSPAARNRLLAHLDLNLVGRGDTASKVVHIFPVKRGGRREMAPGWLVHAVLRGMETVGDRPAVSDPTLPLLGQLAIRLAGASFATDSDAFLRLGVPSVLLSDRGLARLASAARRLENGPARLDEKRLQDWTRSVAATVRRLDGLAGRPAPEPLYLVAFGRVWLRRALYWLGFAVWALLVWRGLPGRWRGARPEERSRRGRAYLPGFAFRMLFLFAVFLAPTFSAVLLLPAAAVVLLAPRGPGARAVGLAVGLLPLVGLTLVLLLLFRDGLGPHDFAWRPAVLVAGTLLAFSLWMRSGSTEP